MRRTPRLQVAAAGLALAALVLPAATGGASLPGHITVGSYDWPTFGASQGHDFVGRTTLDETSARTLAPAWFFPTGDAVTAQPIEVGGTVYVGSWDGHFYAIDAATGKQVWSFTLKPQPAVQPTPGDTPVQRFTQLTSDGGMVTSTALFVPGLGSRPDLVIFGGGYTLYALDASTGRPYWNGPTGPGIDYTGLPEQPPQPTVDGTRIFSSPSLVHVPATTGSNPLPRDEIVFGGSTDGQDRFRGYLAAADLETGAQVWRTETSLDSNGNPVNNGCGGIWGSPTVVPQYQLEVVGVSDCHGQSTPGYADREIAVSTVDGSVAWVFTPPRIAAGNDTCDFDIGATANLGTDANDKLFLGVGGKDGYYYRLDPNPAATQRLLWGTNVVFGGTAGGFLGTTAYDGKRIVGATGIGDFPPPSCEPTNPADQGVQDPSIHAFDPVAGTVQWQGHAANSFAATSMAGGMVFSSAFVLDQIQVRDEATGTLLAAYPLPSSPASGITLAGNAMIFGTGGPEQGSPDGVFAYTPLGTQVVIPPGSPTPGP